MSFGCVCTCESSSCLTAVGTPLGFIMCLLTFASQHALADYQKKFGEDYGSCQAGISNFLTEVSTAAATTFL